MIYDDIPNGDTRKLKIKNAFGASLLRRKNMLL